MIEPSTRSSIRPPMYQHGALPQLAARDDGPALQRPLAHVPQMLCSGGAEHLDGTRRRGAFCGLRHGLVSAAASGHGSSPNTPASSSRPPPLPRCARKVVNPDDAAARADQQLAPVTHETLIRTSSLRSRNWKRRTTRSSCPSENFPWLHRVAEQNGRRPDVDLFPGPEERRIEPLVLGDRVHVPGRPARAARHESQSWTKNTRDRPGAESASGLRVSSRPSSSLPVAHVPLSGMWHQRRVEDLGPARRLAELEVGDDIGPARVGTPGVEPVLRDVLGTLCSRQFTAPAACSISTHGSPPPRVRRGVGQRGGQACAGIAGFV